MQQRTQSFIFGFITIIFWGSLATLGNLLIHLPPFYVLGISFILGALPSLTKPRDLFSEWKVVLLGICGYFFYHFFLFYSFRYAPALEANLINYLWPIFLVLFTALFFPEEKLRWYNLLGGVMAIMGCFLLVLGKGGEFKTENIRGYLLALLAAITWPIYSLTKKKMKSVSMITIGGSCLGAGLLCLMTHALLGPRVVLQWNDAWKLLIMGLGPFGTAFYTWDLALRKGNAKVIGSLAYLTPVISTLGLVIFTQQSVSASTIWAILLIVGGASMGLLDFISLKALNKGKINC